MSRVRSPSETALTAPTKTPGVSRTCIVCGRAYTASQASAKFCADDCRRAFDNRVKQRGVILYHIFMVLRFERDLAKGMGLWTLMCRAASQWREEDRREREGRKSWASPTATIQKNPHLFSVTIKGPK